MSSKQTRASSATSQPSSPTSKKTSAADRTISLFGAREVPNEAQPVETEQPEDVAVEAKEADPSIEGNMDRYRDQAFKVQEWSSKYFGPPSFPGSAWRMSSRIIDGSRYYCLERVWSQSGKKLATYGSILFLDEGEADKNSLFQLAEVVVKAAREKKNGF